MSFRYLLENATKITSKNNNWNDEMIGAILGDIVESRLDHKTGPNPKNFKLFSNDCSFTDDTIQVIAVAQVLLETPKKLFGENL